MSEECGRAGKGDGEGKTEGEWRRKVYIYIYIYREGGVPRVLIAITIKLAALMVTSRREKSQTTWNINHLSISKP